MYFVPYVLTTALPILSVVFFLIMTGDLDNSYALYNLSEEQLGSFSFLHI